MDKSDVSRPRRRILRRAFRLRCQVVRERDFTLIGEHALDVSIEGMLVQTRHKVLTGDDVIVSFEIPATGVWFDAEATVARVLHGRRAGDRGRAVGLVFHGLPDLSARAILSGVLWHLPPPLPRPARRQSNDASQ